jgi:predicted dehydrogenase
MEHFVACVDRGEEPAVSGNDGLRAVEMVLAANQSLRAGGPIPMQPARPKKP